MLLRIAVGVRVSLSLVAIPRMPLDAIPDLSDTQIVLYAKWQSSPQSLESQLTGPVIKALLGSPGVKSIRSVSHMGYSFVYVILTGESKRDAVNRLVADRMASIKTTLPVDATVSVGANASSMGWIYQYALADHKRTRDLRLLNESRIKPAIESVAGVAELASVGGPEKQYQLKLFPPLLAATGSSLRQIVTTLQSALQEVGGRTIEVTNRDYQIRGVVSDSNIDQIEQMVVGHAGDGTPVRLKDVGYIQVGYDQRRSVADLNGYGEVTGGIVIIEQRQNVLNVRNDLERRFEQVKATLPAGIEIVATYDRGALIWDTVAHFARTLLYELVIVIMVVALFLRNARAAIAPICVLLLGVVLTALPLYSFAQTINLLSLAGLFIAIGAVALQTCSATR